MSIEQIASNTRIVVIKKLKQQINLLFELINWVIL